MEEGMSVPEGSWPRLVQGVNFREPLTWDLLQALALMDAVAGAGGAFWGEYSRLMLPVPEELTLPLCWEEGLLGELQHADIQRGAMAQQERLRGLFPGLAKAPGPGTPSWLQWGFACVRSRAFKVAAEGWASIPFLDMANHAQDPNADFTVGQASSSKQGQGPGEGYWLVAVRDINAGDEITISYSGPEGYTNQRFMAQYGFVPSGGNMADRLQLDIPEGSSLSMDRAEDVLGPAILLEAAQGRNPYLFATLKSLPLVVDGGEGRGGDGEAQQRRLAGALLAQVESQISGCSTTLAEDEGLLAELEGRRTPAAEADGRAAAAVRYRVERKRLLRAAKVLLGAYSRGGA